MICAIDPSAEKSMQEISEFLGISLSVLDWIAVIVGILLGIIGIYKFFLKRPNLALSIDLLTLDENNKVPIWIIVENNGRRFADDVFIRLELKNLQFVPLTDEEGEISASGEDVDDLLGSFVEYNEVSSIIQDKFRDNQLRLYYLNNPVYSNTHIQLTGRLAEFEPNGPYEIRYEIACRSHEPRSGTIRLYRQGETIITEGERPNLRRRFFRFF